MVEGVSNQTPFVVVNDPMQVDLLLNLNAMRHFAPFVRGPRTLGEAAAELSVPPSTLAYWTGRLQRVGLLEVVERRPRAGKPIPVYRATANEYRIPLGSMSPGTKEEFMNSGRRKVFDRFVTAVDRTLEKFFSDGIAVRGHPERGIEIGFVDPPDGRTPPVTEWWGIVELTDDEATSLHVELNDLVRRYSHDRPEKGRRSHVVVVGLAAEPRSPRARH